ncbi:unnamed protein product [Lampetra fluviatilis]
MTDSARIRHAMLAKVGNAETDTSGRLDDYESLAKEEKGSQGGAKFSPSLTEAAVGGQRRGFERVVRRALVGSGDTAVSALPYEPGPFPSSIPGRAHISGDYPNSPWASLSSTWP